jgi:diguanylate cyclase (GGDEF)-like protein/PAS domain S-box-containing protein
MAIFIQLLYNLGILVAISIIAGFIGQRSDNNRNMSPVQGVIFGSAAVIAMLHPFVVAPGLIFDGRSIMISISGLFFGPVASTIAAFMAIILRVFQGGTGTIAGILVIFMAAVTGTLFYMRNKRKNKNITTKSLYIMGMIVHIAMVLLMFTLPDNKGMSTIKLIGLPVIIFYPIATVIIGWILLEADERRRIVKALRESQTSLIRSNQELNTAMEELTATEEELRTQFDELQISNERIIQSELLFNSALDNAPIPIMLRADDGQVLKISRQWTEITGYTIQDIPTVDDWITKAYGQEKYKMKERIKNTYDSANKPDYGEYQIRTASGQTRIWHFNASEIGKISDGRKVVMTAATDITERKETEKALKKSESRLIAAQSMAHVGNWEINLNTMTMWASQEAFNIYGIEYVSPFLPLDIAQDVVLPEYREEMDAALMNLINQKQKYDQEFEIRNVQTGEERFIHSKAKLLLDQTGKPAKVVGTIQDITEQKNKEQEILYVSYHDYLTGLYSRRYYEEELMRLDSARNLPLTIVLGDVNGLKLINDSFGHVMGDELLKKVAEVIRKGCRADDIVARLGGDEFVILLPKTDSHQTEQIIKRIKALLSMEKVGSINISISFGYETKNNQEEKIQDIFKKAEDHMFKDKIIESQSMRGKTIQTIITTLNEKNKREEQHSHRVSILCKSMGEALNLNEGKVEELKTVGLLHDIGKIAIDENILNKNGRLTEIVF